MMREPMFRAEQWGMKEEYPDDDGVRCRAMAADSRTLSRYLLPNPAAGQAWATSAETSNLVRMRSQALGQSAPSLTASLIIDLAVEL
ncbi:hypothetical protein E5288_WYG012860 [Bos mutus]|uniref:Uncharacterized protein n=1 Tax=Bos mutus TaxID=72004 RepID=A0A6B0QVJ6_9CETA|nr:hypothetical protein [Bos mutus]